MRKSAINFLLFLTMSNHVVGQVYTQGNGAVDIDGNVYATIVFGNGQEWFAENLKASHYSTGDTIPYVQGTNDWSMLNSGAWCWHDNNQALDSIFGKLYNWYVIDEGGAGAEQNVCPVGWSVPDNDDWASMALYLDPNSDTTESSGIQSTIAGGMMKSTGLDYWNPPNAGATNQSGFSGLPGGNRSYSGAWSVNIYDYGFWWSSTLYDNNEPYMVRLDYENPNFSRYYDFAGLGKRLGFSIRCLKNQTVTSALVNLNKIASVSPNPSTGIFTVNVPDQTNIQVSVYDALGKLVTSSNEKGTFNLDLSEVPVGIYTLRLDTESGTVTKKLVRE